MEFKPYAEDEVCTVFQDAEWWPYYMRAVNWKKTNWEKKLHFLKGPCLKFHEPKSHHCRCHEEDREEASREEWFSSKTLTLLIGNCPSCLLAGTIGYLCQGCMEDKYKLLVYPVKYAGSDDYDRAMLGPIGPFHLTAKHNKGIYMIVPPCPIELAGLFNHEELIVMIHEKDWMYVCTVGKPKKMNDGMPLILQASGLMGEQTLKGMADYIEAKEGYKPQNP